MLQKMGRLMEEEMRNSPSTIGCHCENGPERLQKIGNRGGLCHVATNHLGANPLSIAAWRGTLVQNLLALYACTDMNNHM